MFLLNKAISKVLSSKSCSCKRVPAPREDRLAGDPIVPKLLLPKPDGEANPPPEQSWVPRGKQHSLLFPQGISILWLTQRGNKKF